MLLLSFIVANLLIVNIYASYQYTKTDKERTKSYSILIALMSGLVHSSLGVLLVLINVWKKSRASTQ